MFSSEELVDEAEFIALSETILHGKRVIVTKHNYCPDCPNIAMETNGNEYQCPQCGQTRSDIECDKDHNDTVNSSIRRTTGSNKGKYYTINGDYAKTQHKSIYDQLLQNQRTWTGTAFPNDVLNAVADQYNQLQKVITEDINDDEGKTIGKKKFVRRGNIKDEVLAALIYYECVRKKIVRKKNDIAGFMKLHTQGWSKGDEILRELAALGKIDLLLDEEPIIGFVEQYMETLNLDNPSYNKFIIELVEKSEELKIGMKSHLPSKIVGSIWILIEKLGLKITQSQLETSCNNCKKNTFMKFRDIVINNMGAFAPVFVANNIPYK
jgi:transcription initiation factor TFIIIB Brf1 subunit/transcription initiation factor TFIIB